MTCQWYFRRIRIALAAIGDASRETFPGNRGQVGGFVNSRAIITIERILSGLRGIDDWDGVDWENHTVFLKFKDWILGDEKRYKTMLRRLSYCIDQDNTLNTVTRGGRPESVCL